MIAQSVHDTSEELEITQKIFENLPLKWTKAFNLSRNQETLIPFDWFFMINEFNGPSAGNCVEEALSQGLCEIVERHVSSIISRNKVRTQAINTNSITEPTVLEMIQKYRNAGIKLFLTDFTLDIGIPSIGALAYDPNNFPEKSEIVWTAGTTPDPQKALSRALTEVAQLAGDFNTNSNYVASGLPKFGRIEDADFIINPSSEIDISMLPDLSDINIRVEVQNCISALAQKSMEVIAINTMHPLLEIPAFYTIVPGAHFRERALGTSVGMFATKFISQNAPPQEAIWELRKIEQVLKEKYYVKFYLGSCYLALNDPETALKKFHQAITNEPNEEDMASIYSYMAICLKDMGEYENALKFLREGASIDDERTDIYNLMGFCHYKLKQHEMAISCFKKVLRLDPSSAIDYANIASNYRELGEKEKAIRYYEMALMLDTSIEFARENLAKMK
jgi:ribosomal protein S12 methylthiotransferase accessory factor